jgi:hypothetical protein
VLVNNAGHLHHRPALDVTLASGRS